MQRAHGFTLVELLITLAILAILLTVVVPGFGDLMQRRRIEGVAAELSTDLQFARSEAVSRQANVTVATNSAGTQYTVASNVTKTVVLPTGITVTPNVTRVYEGLRGTATSAGTSGGNESINISSAASAATLRVNGTVMGRVQICSPGQTLKGYSECP